MSLGKHMCRPQQQFPVFISFACGLDFRSSAFSVSINHKTKLVFSTRTPFRGFLNITSIKKIKGLFPLICQKLVQNKLQRRPNPTIFRLPPSYTIVRKKQTKNKTKQYCLPIHTSKTADLVCNPRNTYTSRWLSSSLIPTHYTCFNSQYSTDFRVPVHCLQDDKLLSMYVQGLTLLR